MRTEGAFGMPFLFPSASPSSSPEEVWKTAFHELSQRIRRYFVRQEPHQQALAYLQGLMSPLERKNGWQVAEEMGEATPYAMQHLLDRARWDCDGVRDELRQYVVEMLAAPNGVLVIDETGFLKKGRKSVGVQRQYSGTAGRIENCQMGVFRTSASSRGHTLLDRELYLPKSWTDDQERCREAHVPVQMTFATKPELARRMLERTLDSGLPVAWVTGDTIYGNHRPLRTYLEERRQAYALGISCRECVEVDGVRKRADHFAHQIDAQAWQALSCGEGSKGPRLYEWARLCTSDEVVPGWQQHLVIRRTLPSGVQQARACIFSRVCSYGNDAPGDGASSRSALDD